MIDGFWSGRSVLITGSTGFKGAWLATWLKLQGAKVTGLALAPNTDPSLWRLLEADLDVPQVFVDIRDRATVQRAFARSQPEVVFHLAAQSLVRRGYCRPAETFDVNVVGTANVLDSALQCDAIRAVVVVTSDKVYDPRKFAQPYEESSALGGAEPYGASKACTEIVVTAYRESFFRPKGVPVATARAGNVVGGGDWAADRLVPDTVRMLAAGTPVLLRYPEATRPWQHVLDPLRGYLLLAERLVVGQREIPETLNFGPPLASCVCVSEVVDRLTELWGGQPGWSRTHALTAHEAPALTLSSEMAMKLLSWTPVLDLDRALQWTAEWYDQHRRGADIWRSTCDQIRRFDELAR